VDLSTTKYYGKAYVILLLRHNDHQRLKAQTCFSLPFSMEKGDQFFGSGSRKARSHRREVYKLITRLEYLVLLLDFTDEELIKRLLHGLGRGYNRRSPMAKVSSSMVHFQGSHLFEAMEPRRAWVWCVFVPLL
jgi:hypothetical protein